jgi:solute carrier family 40 (iron-regulated transporter), member 1
MKDATTSILISRFLTRFGDQAWDFALPLTLISLFPAHAGLVIAIFLVSKLTTILVLPRLASIVDEWPRMKTVTFGTMLQFISVIVVSGFVFVWSYFSNQLTNANDFSLNFIFVALLLGTVAANLGSSIMEIALGNDWIPELIPFNRRAQVNSRMRQIDLFTEVTAPIAAGFLLLFNSTDAPLVGFFLIALWNSTSFFPEIFLLRRVLKISPQLQRKLEFTPKIQIKSLHKMRIGWLHFTSQKAAPAMFAYALLWLSALSPHGVILTTFLKNTWQMSELNLGVFRGAGAVFGLFATFIFPFVTRKIGLIQASNVFIWFQVVTLFVSLPLFFNQFLNGWAFLLFVLFSRIGLYGFSLGELEIRQRYISQNLRGKINGVASALNSCATLFLFSFGALFPTNEGFAILTCISVASVFFSGIIFSRWSKTISNDTVRGK